MNKQTKSRPKYYLGFTDLRNQGFSNYLIGQIMFTADGEKTYIISEYGSRLFLVPAVIEAMKFKLSSPRLSKKIEES